MPPSAVERRKLQCVRASKIGPWTSATPTDEATFQGGVRGFIARNLPDSSTPRAALAGSRTRTTTGARKLGEAGYAGLTWPREYGGAGAPYSHKAIFLEELARAEAPSPSPA